MRERMMPELDVLNKLSEYIHNNNKDKGFYDEPKEPEKLLVDMVEEIGEMNNAIRKGLFASKIEDQNAAELLEDYVKQNKSAFEFELADLIIRCFDAAGYMNVDLMFFIKQKLLYNQTRPYKHGKLS